MSKYSFTFPLISLLTLLLSFTACSEADDTVEEYGDWQAKNEAYFEQQYQAAYGSPDALILKKVSLPDTLTLDEVAHTDCILVDVLERGTDDTESPVYTSTVEVHYRGRFIPSPSYPSGYVFDNSYTGDFDAAVCVPTSFQVNNVVEGFATALQHMHRGDHWRVTIPYQLGYGKDDYGSIPGYSTLIFEIRLADF